MRLKNLLFISGLFLSLPSLTKARELFDSAEIIPFSPYSLTWTPPYRTLVSVGANGSSLEMDDGSVWNIKSSCQKKVRQWAASDYLVFYPGSSFWNRSNFWAYNARLKSKARSELSLGPIQFGPCTNHVQQIDYYRGECLLQDGRGYQNLWKISFEDINRFQRWHLSDAIIIGSRNNPSESPYGSTPYILLNVQENDYVKAAILY